MKRNVAFAQDWLLEMLNYLRGEWGGGWAG